MYKKAVQQECNVCMDVVPISKVIKSLWTIKGEVVDIKLALHFMHRIYLNTIIKTNKSKQPSPIREDNPTRSQELKEDQCLQPRLPLQKILEPGLGTGDQRG